MGTTKIDWADRVWNPVTGCTKVSAGCKHCYAEGIARRFWGDRDFGDVILHKDRLDDPGKWKKPQRVFVDSMSDLFHELVPFGFILQVFYRMGQHDRHTYVILTKRPGRMLEFFERWSGFVQSAKDMGNAYFEPPLNNVWLGVSVENQKAADERIPLLLKAPAEKRIVSVEPMLEGIDISSIGCFGTGQCLQCAGSGETAGHRDQDDGMDTCSACGGSGEDKSAKIDGVFCGCESGVGRRPFDWDGARSLRDQCQAAGVKFFFKQAPIGGKIVKMPVLDGKVWDEVPG